MDLAEAVTQRVRRVAEPDREHRRAVFLVVHVHVVRVDRRSPAHARTDQRSGEHLTDVTLLDQVAHISHRRRGARLQARHRQYSFFLRQCGEALRLLETVAERPLAVHRFARVECRAR